MSCGMSVMWQLSTRDQLMKILATRSQYSLQKWAKHMYAYFGKATKQISIKYHYNIIHQILQFTDIHVHESTVNLNFYLIPYLHIFEVAFN